MAPDESKSELGEMVAAAMSGDPDAALAAAKRGYAAFLRGELDLDDPAVDPEMEWIPPKHTPTASGTYRGSAGAREEVSTWSEPFDEYTWEPKEVLLGEDSWVVVGDTGGRGRTSGIDVGMEEFHVWSVRHGRIVRMQMFLNRGEALAAAGLTQAA